MEQGLIVGLIDVGQELEVGEEPLVTVVGSDVINNHPTSAEIYLIFYPKGIRQGFNTSFCPPDATLSFWNALFAISFFDSSSRWT